MDEQGLGKKLQAARQAAGLTQQQLCQKANLSFSTLTKIERGAIKAPSIFTIQAIAAALGQSLDELLGTASPAPRSYAKTKSGVSFIYFDVNGSLVNYFQQAFTKIAEETGVPADLIESGFWHYNDEVCRGTMSVDDFNRAMCERLHVEFFDWKTHYLAAIQPVKPLQELLTWASQYYRVGILTNIMPGFISAMQTAGKLPKLDYAAVVDSSEIGAVKPEQRIYDIATERAGVPPNEIMLIDDTRTNLVAAEWLGWRVMLFDDYQMDDSIAKLRDALEPANQEQNA